MTTPIRSTTEYISRAHRIGLYPQWARPFSENGDIECHPYVLTRLQATEQALEWVHLGVESKLGDVELRLKRRVGEVERENAELKEGLKALERRLELLERAGGDTVGRKREVGNVVSAGRKSTEHEVSQVKTEIVNDIAPSVDTSAQSAAVGSTSHTSQADTTATTDASYTTAANTTQTQPQTQPPSQHQQILNLVQKMRELDPHGYTFVIPRYTKLPSLPSTSTTGNTTGPQEGILAIANPGQTDITMVTASTGGTSTTSTQSFITASTATPPTHSRSVAVQHIDMDEDASMRTATTTDESRSGMYQSEASTHRTPKASKAPAPNGVGIPLPPSAHPITRMVNQGSQDYPREQNTYTPIAKQAETVGGTPTYTPTRSYPVPPGGFPFPLPLSNPLPSIQSTTPSSTADNTTTSTISEPSIIADQEQQQQQSYSFIDLYSALLASGAGASLSGDSIHDRNPNISHLPGQLQGKAREEMVGSLIIPHISRSTSSALNYIERQMRQLDQRSDQLDHNMLEFENRLERKLGREGAPSPSPAALKQDLLDERKYHNKGREGERGVSGGRYRIPESPSPRNSTTRHVVRSIGETSHSDAATPRIDRTDYESRRIVTAPATAPSNAKVYKREVLETKMGRRGAYMVMERGYRGAISQWLPGTAR